MLASNTPCYRDFDFDYRQQKIVSIGKYKTLNLVKSKDDDKELWRNDLSRLNNHPVKDAIGVVDNKDVQKYVKRLRRNIERIYKKNNKEYENEKTKVYIVAEYGGKRGRPHFHLLVFPPPKSQYVDWKTASLSAWKYDNHTPRKRQFEFSRKPSHYVASYLSGYEGLHNFCRKNSEIRAKSSHSLYFGANLQYFNISKISEMLAKRTLRINRSYIDKHGTRVSTSVPLSPSIQNYHFPLFKGVGRLTTSQIYRIVANPLKVYEYTELMQTTKDDCKKIVTLLLNRHERFSFLNLSQRNDYARLFVDYILVRKNESLCNFYDEQNEDGHPWYSYDNIDEFDNNPDRWPALLDYASDTNTHPDILNPNEYPKNIQRTIQSEESYWKHLKNKRINKHLHAVAGLD